MSIAARVTDPRYPVAPLTSISLRTTPRQDRATSSVNLLLDATGAMLDETGIDLVTTADVARRSGVSIGTVYRYFPDRIALLNALRARALDAYRSALEFETMTATSQADIARAAVRILVDAYRTIPGFRIIASGALDSPDRMRRELYEHRSHVRRLLGGVAVTDATLRGDASAVSTVLLLAEALIGRAFSGGRLPDETEIADMVLIIERTLPDPRC